MPPESESSEQEEEDISPLQYARENGIASNHLVNMTSSFSHTSNFVKQHIEENLDDDPNLPIFDFGQELRLEERLTFSREAAKLLTSIATSDTVESSDTTDWTLGRRQRKMKLELPLLKSDHELDCKNFTRRDDFEIDLADVKFPLELVDDEKGEGLGWPRSLKDYGPSLLQDLKKEGLAVHRDTMHFIQNALRCDWTQGDEHQLWTSENRNQNVGGDLSTIEFRANKFKKRIKEPITPPLLPAEMSSMLDNPNSEADGFDMPILSDPPDLMQLDLKAIEAKIFKQDVPTPIRNPVQGEGSSDTYLENRDISMKEIYSPLASLDNSPPLPTANVRFKAGDFKVETPLTPMKPTVSPSNTVRFPNVVLQLDFDQGSPGHSQSDGLGSRFFEDALHAHEKVTRQSEQEQLVHADALSRVEIPKMDFTPPDPPWKVLAEARSSNDLAELQKWSMRDTFEKFENKPSHWPGVQQVSNQLKWEFPRHLAQAATTDGFPEGGEVLMRFVGKLEKVIDSSALVWKPEGLMVLMDEGDDDDDIEGGKFLSTSQDLSFFLKKRKLSLEREAERICPNSKTKSEAGPSKRTKLSSVGALAHSASLGTLLDGRFSARNAVDNYMTIKGIRKPELSSSPHFDRQVNAVSDLKLAPSPRQQQLELPIRKSPLSNAVTIPTPKFDIPQSPFYVIMSTTMYKKKELVRKLEKTFPTLNLIERDFTAHNTTSWLAGSVSRSPIVSPLASEADFIVSPSVGIVVTTLQKIRQKPLPGQKAKTEIRDRVEQVSLRYENLLIIVSEDSKDDTTNGLDSYDCEALTEFNGFKAALDSNVIVQFVPGGDGILSKWLMSALVQHRSADELLTDQTHWELFLRRAGMNAFAAQVILSRMKAPEGVNGSSPTKAGNFGLTGFVEMGDSERINRFENLCGRRLLERVSAVIDAKWM